MCAHIISPKKKWQLICGNGIVEIEGKKICGKRQKRIFEIDLGVILIGGFIGNDQWIYSKHRIRIRWRGEVIGWLILHLQYKEGTWHTHKIGQKNYWRIRISVLYFFFYLDSSLSLSLSSNFLFRQCHCHKFIPTNFFSSILAMPLP